MRVACFDIEATGLDADRGRILCACIKPFGKKVITLRADKRPEYRQRITDDRWLVRQILGTLNDFDLIVTWYGERYDVPFLRSRAMNLVLRVPRLNLLHIDLWKTCRTVLKLRSNRLANVRNFLKLPDDKTPLDFAIWEKATAGVAGVMDDIVKHCVQDVKVLEQTYQRLLPYVKTIPRLLV